MAQNSRFFIHSVFSSLRFASKRVAVIFIAIFIGAAVSAAFLNLYFDTNSKMSKELKAYGANLVISPKNGEIFIDTNAVYGAFSRVDKAHLLSYIFMAFLVLVLTLVLSLGLILAGLENQNRSYKFKKVALA